MNNSQSRIYKSVCTVFCAMSLFLNVGCATIQEVDLTSYPSADRPWSEDDYKQLNELVEAGRVSLPKLTDPASKAIFERMVSRKNTVFIVAKDESIRPDQRFQTIVGAMRSISLLLSKYGKQARQLPSFEREMAKLMIYSLDLSCLTINFMEKNFKELEKNKGYIEKKNKMYSSLVQLYNKIFFDSLGKPYSKTSRLEIFNALRRSVSQYNAAFNFATRFKISNGIQAVLMVTKDPEEKEALEKLNAAIKGE